MVSSVPNKADKENTYNNKNSKVFRKRNRVPVACNVCRRRKVRCDREKPHCDNCKKYNVSHLCVYATPSFAIGLSTNDGSPPVTEEQASFSSAAFRPPQPPQPSQPSQPPQPPQPNTIMKKQKSPEEATPTEYQPPTIPPMQAAAIKSEFSRQGSFNNNIPSILNHNGGANGNSSFSQDSVLEMHNPLQYKNFRDINHNQSSERSTATLPPLRQQLPPLLGAPVQAGALRTQSGSDPATIAPGLSPPTITNEITSSQNLQSELAKMKQKMQLIEESLASYTKNANTASCSPPKLDQPFENIHTESKPSNTALALAQPTMTFADQEPSITPTTTIDFYKGYIPVHVRQSRTMNYGPLSWICLLKKDSFLRIVWAKVVEQNRRRKYFPFNLAKRKRDDDDRGTLAGDESRKDQREGEENNGDENEEQRSRFFVNDKTGRVSTGDAHAEHKLLQNIYAVSSTGPQNEYEKKFCQKLMEQEGIVDIQPYKKGKFRELDARSEHKEVDTLKGVEVPYVHSTTKQSQELTLIKAIESELPSKKVIWMNVDRFFKYMYVYLPCLDQEMFVEDITKIIGAKSYEDVKLKNISLEKRLDFANLGILLLVVRLGYLTACVTSDSWKKQERNEEEAFILQNAISPDLSSMAQSCLNQFNLLRTSSLNVFQLALLMKMYRGLAPEESECSSGGDSSYGGLLIQMGITLGLNRDPENFGMNGKMVNLWRKLWSLLMLVDYKQVHRLGYPSMINPDSYDTKPCIFLGPRTSNLSDLSDEKVAVEYLNRSIQNAQIISGLTDLILKIKTAPLLSDVIGKLSELDESLETTSGNLKRILTPNNFNYSDNALKLSNILHYLECRSMMATCYHHIILLFESKKDPRGCMHYLKKMLTSIIEIVYHFSNLLNHSTRYIGVGFDVLLTPRVEAAMHKTLQIQISMIIRAHHLKALLGQHGTLSAELNVLLDKLCDLLLKNVDKYQQGMAQLSDRYYYAWRMSKAQHFVLNILRKSASKMFEKDETHQKISIASQFTGSVDAPEYNFFQDLSIQDFEVIVKLVDPDVYKADIICTGDNTPNMHTVSSTDDDTETRSALTDSDIDKIWLQMMTNSATSWKNMAFDSPLRAYDDSVQPGFNLEPDQLNPSNEIDIERLFEEENLQF